MFQLAEAEDEQDEESINTDYIPLTTDLSGREGTDQLFILNRNNQRQKLTQYNKIVSPSTIHAKIGNDNKQPGWQSGPRRVICHNCYVRGHYLPD